MGTTKLMQMADFRMASPTSVGDLIEFFKEAWGDDD